MKDYPLHHHNTHIVHPKGANIKYCPHCMEEKPFDNCVIKDKAIWFNNQVTYSLLKSSELP